MKNENEKKEGKQKALQHVNDDVHDVHSNNNLDKTVSDNVSTIETPVGSASTTSLDQYHHQNADNNRHNDSSSNSNNNSSNSNSSSNNNNNVTVNGSNGNSVKDNNGSGSNDVNLIQSPQPTTSGTSSNIHPQNLTPADHHNTAEGTGGGEDDNHLLMHVTKIQSEHQLGKPSRNINTLPSNTPSKPSTINTLTQIPTSNATSTLLSPFRHTLLPNPFTPPSQYPLPTYPINTPSQHTLLPLFRRTPSTFHPNILSTSFSSHLHLHPLSYFGASFTH